MIWALATGSPKDRCGLCGRAHADGDVIALRSSAALVRCVVCAGTGPTLDELAELRLERCRALAEQARQREQIQADRARANREAERVTSYASRARKTLTPFHRLPASLRRRHNQQAGNQ